MASDRHHPDQLDLVAVSDKAGRVATASNLPTSPASSDEGVGCSFDEEWKDETELKVEFVRHTSTQTDISGPGERKRSQQFNDEQKYSPRGLQFTQRDATTISEDTGQSWRDVGRQLSFREAVLDNIHEENTSNKERAQAMYIRYARSQGASASKTEVAHALCNAGRRDVAENLIDAEFFEGTDKKKCLILKKVSPRCRTSPMITDPLEFKMYQDADGKRYFVAEEIARNERRTETKQPVQDTAAKEDSCKKSRESKRISEIERELEKLTEDLKIIAGAQEVPEVRRCSLKLENQLSIACQTNMHIQSWYSKLIKLTGEISQYTQKYAVSKELYEFSRGLQAQQRDLNTQVKSLGERIDEMTDEDRRKYTNLLQSCKISKTRFEQIERLFSNLLRSSPSKRTESEPPRRMSLLNRLRSMVTNTRRCDTGPADMTISPPILRHTEETVSLAQDCEKLELPTEEKIILEHDPQEVDV